ncbi:MAG: TetR/AcrR family transcriptional regulator [Actinomycetota bacterium]
MSTAPDRRPLTRERILAAALRLIDARGLDAFSMRTLGAELGVQAMSLYRHLPGREAILDGVVALLLDEVAWAPRGGPWPEELAEWARAYRRVALDHPNAFPLVADRPAAGYVAAREGAERTLGRMVADGLTPREAAHALRVVVRYVVGFSLAGISGGADAAHAAARLAGDGYPLLAELVADAGPGPDDEVFELGLRLIVEGLRAELTSRGAARGRRGRGDARPPEP